MGVAQQELFEVGTQSCVSFEFPSPSQLSLSHLGQALCPMRNIPETIHHQILGVDLSNCVVRKNLEHPLSPWWE